MDLVISIPKRGEFSVECIQLVISRYRTICTLNDLEVPPSEGRDNRGRNEVDWRACKAGQSPDRGSKGALDEGEPLSGQF
jgi:hypothetical protein